MKLHLSIIVALLFLPHTNKAYNIAYNGNDPYVSYETSWGKERFVKEDYIKYFPYYKKHIENIVTASLSLEQIQALPYPYSTLTTIYKFNPFGMYFNAAFITKLFENNTIINVIEIGSYFGVSTRHIASLLPQNGKLFAIDDWAYFPGMYEQFLSNIVSSNQTDKIIPVREKSQNAVPSVTENIKYFDLIYIDGDHETAGVLLDLNLYFPLAGDTGIVCGDDWLLTTVRAAVVQFAQENDLTVYGACNFWFLKKDNGFEIKSHLEASKEAWKFNQTF